MNRAIPLSGASAPRRQPLCRIALLSIALAAISSLGSPAPARAQPAAPDEAPALTPEQRAAMDLFEEGKTLFRADRFEEALKHFEQAYVVFRHPAIGWWQGRTLARANRCAEALPLLVGVRGKLGADDEARKAEAIRSQEEGACRVTLARDHMKGFGCRTALDVLGSFDRAAARAGDVAEAGRLVATAEPCAAAFDTTSARGRKAAARHAAAREHLGAARYSEAVASAEASLDLQPTAVGRLVRGLALAGLGSCTEALPLLEAAATTVGPEDVTAHGAALVACRHAEARRLVEAEDCRAALPLLESLRGQMKGKADRWRKTSEKWCRPRATEFLTDTSMRRAAYQLFVGARAASSSGDRALAAKRYQRALGMVDEPLIRRELGVLLLHDGADGCAAVTAALGPLGDQQRTIRDDAMLLGCGAWLPRRPHDGAALIRYVDLVAATLRAQAADEWGAALSALDQVHKAGDSPVVAAARLDLVYEAGQCSRYLDRLAAATTDQLAHVRDLDTRRRQCQAPTSPPAGGAAGTSEDDAAGEPGEGAPDSVVRSNRHEDTTALDNLSATHGDADLADTPDDEGVPWGWIAAGAGVVVAGGVALVLGLLLQPEPRPVTHSFTLDVP